MDFYNIFKTLSAGSKFERENKRLQREEKLQSEQTRLTYHASNVKNLSDIEIHGKDIPTTIETFEELEKYNLPGCIIQNINTFGYLCPTLIQKHVMPIMFSKREVLAAAPTGSGKTAAFMLPLIGLLKQHRNGGSRVLVICPTRELAEQLYQEFIILAEGTTLKAVRLKKVTSLKTKGIILLSKYDVIISTPQRLLYLLEHHDTQEYFNKVEWLIMDEADKLFEEGFYSFRDQLGKIYTSFNRKEVKKSFFSATYTPEVTEFCKTIVPDVISITVGIANSAVSHIEQQLIFVGSENSKIVEFRSLLHQGMEPPILVFLESKQRAKQLFQELLFDGIHVDMIHSERTDEQRNNTVKAFREGKVWVLICTELMGRGIDFKGVKLVINYDFPPSAISYIHRIGRTGRAGRPGKAITFFTNADKPVVKSIANLLQQSGCPVPQYMFDFKITDFDKFCHKNNELKGRISISTDFNRQKRFMSRRKISEEGENEPKKPKSNLTPKKHKPNLMSKKHKSNLMSKKHKPNLMSKKHKSNLTLKKHKSNLKPKKHKPNLKPEKSSMETSS